MKQQHGLAPVAALHAGVVTVVQRFRSDLGLYVHLHCLATDGAYEEQNDGELRFLAAPPPTPERMTAVLAQVHEVVRAAARHRPRAGRLPAALPRRPAPRARATDGSVRCWGSGYCGQLGYGNLEDIGDDELPSSVGPVAFLP